jgi:hypothetical protein
MDFLFRFRKQIEEALGPDNRWFCSEFHGRHVDDPEILLEYFVRQGGAADFARRFAEAMGDKNRWFCSEFYRTEITDPQILWNYYITHRGGKPKTPTSTDLEFTH